MVMSVAGLSAGELQNDSAPKKRSIYDSRPSCAGSHDSSTLFVPTCGIDFDVGKVDSACGTDTKVEKGSIHGSMSSALHINGQVFKEDSRGHGAQASSTCALRSSINTFEGKFERYSNLVPALPCQI